MYGCLTKSEQETMRAGNNATAYHAVEPGFDYIDIWLTFKSLPNSIKYTSIILNTIGIASHSVGLYLLSTAKRNRATSNSDNMVFYTNFKLLIMLSVCELLSALIQIIVVASYEGKHPIVTKIVQVLFTAVSAVAFSTIFLITLNRLLSISYPLWYRSFVTKKKFIGAVVLTSLAFVCLFAGMQFFSFWYITYVLGYVLGAIVIILICFYFVFCIFSYVLIAKKILQSRRVVQSNNVVDENPEAVNCVYFIYTAMRKQGYTAPFLITFSYLVFIIVPYMSMWVYSLFSDLTSIAIIWYISYGLNNISDALIYVFFDRDIRNSLRNMFARREGRIPNNDESQTSHGDTEI